MIHIELANAENMPEKYHDKVHQTETTTGTVIRVEGKAKDVFNELVALLTFFDNNEQYKPLFLMAMLTSMPGGAEVKEQIDLLKEMDA